MEYRQEFNLEKGFFFLFDHNERICIEIYITARGTFYHIYGRTVSFGVRRITNINRVDGPCNDFQTIVRVREGYFRVWVHRVPRIPVRKRNRENANEGLGEKCIRGSRFISDDKLNIL